MEPNCDTAGLTHDLLKELFDYRDGELYWKVSRQGRKLGVPAGAIRSDGYRVIVINGKHYRTHRLIFLYHHGFLPEYLDHIDCKKKRLGLFDSEIKAAKTYNHAAVEAFGEFKNLNKFEVN